MRHFHVWNKRSYAPADADLSDINLYEQMKNTAYLDMLETVYTFRTSRRRARYAIELNLEESPCANNFVGLA